MRLYIYLLSFLFVPLLSSAQSNPEVISLWPNGAPGFENRKNEPEEAKDWWVKNIHNPSITVFLPPKEKANGTAVLICPGGGHRQLVIKAEGTEAAEYLNTLGITAFVLKYRLAREENSPYKLEEHVKQDAYRAMRLIRSKATAFHINPERIGILGFSAGGEVVSLIAYDDGTGNENAKDPIDKLNGKPNFQLLVYSGPLFIPEKIDKTAPPAFMVAANDDQCCSEPIVKLLRLYRENSVPIEVHLYTKGGHGFNMGNRSKLKTISTWPQRMADWLEDNGWLDVK